MARLLTPNCPQCNQPARGTVEVLSGMATIAIEEDGEYDHDGNGTEIWWDCAETKTNERGEISLICREGHEWFSPVEMPVPEVAK